MYCIYQSVDCAGFLVIDGHDEPASDAHTVAAEEAVAEEGGDGGVNGGSVST